VKHSQRLFLVTIQPRMTVKTHHMASLCASMQSLSDDLLRMILMLLPQDDRCHDNAGTDTANQRAGSAMMKQWTIRSWMQ
jgi:hypothetical protein